MQILIFNDLDGMRHHKICETEMPQVATTSNEDQNLKVLHFDLAPPAVAYYVIEV